MIAMRGMTKQCPGIFLLFIICLSYTTTMTLGFCVTSSVSESKYSNVLRTRTRQRHCLKLNDQDRDQDLISMTTNTNRRALLEGAVTTSTSTLLGTLLLLVPKDKANALAVAPLPPPPQTPTTYSMAPQARIEGIGGGFDIRSPSPNALKAADVVYPPSMVGAWQCQRVVTSVEGDKGQALVAWKALGGGGGGSGEANSEVLNYFTKQKIESYQTKYVESVLSNDDVVVLDRGYEMASRTFATNLLPPIWNVQSPNKLRYYPIATSSSSSNDNNNFVQIEVVQRTVEVPTDQGFGFNELYKISTPVPGLFGTSSDQILERAVRVQRRYRRAFDSQGNRVVEGLEIMKTYRVLDGVAGIEMPTSTTKSQIRMTRPPTTATSSP